MGLAAVKRARAGTRRKAKPLDGTKILRSQLYPGRLQGKQPRAQSPLGVASSRKGGKKGKKGKKGKANMGQVSCKAPDWMENPSGKVNFVPRIGA